MQNATAYAHQRKCNTWLSHRPRGIVAMDQGLGKTYCAVIDCERNRGYPALVVPPAHAKFVWRDEWAAWAPQRKVQVIQPDGFFDESADVWIINYDVLRRTYLPDCRTMIIDECHYITNRTALRTKKVAQHARSTRVKRVRLLSGTPMQRPIDLWVPMTIVGATNMSWTDFGKRYAAGYLDQWKQWNMTGSSHEDELREKLAGFLFRVEKNVALPDMPPKTWTVIALDLPVDERERAYSLDDIARVGTATPFEGLSEILRLQSETKLPSALKFIDDLLAEEEQKIIVFCWHRETVRAIVEHFAAAGVESVAFNGDVSESKRAEAIEAFQRGAARLFVGNLHAAGSALTLTAASCVVFVEGSWNPNVMEQCADRAHRIGQTRPVRCFVLTVDQSIDHKMVRRCLEKLRVIKQIIVPTIETESEKMSNHLVLKELAKVMLAAGSFLEAEGNKLAAQADAPATTPPATSASTDGPRRGRPPSPASKGSAAATPAVAAKGPTSDEVRKTVIDYIRGEDDTDTAAMMQRKSIALQIMGKFGADKVEKLPEAAYATIISEIKSVGASNTGAAAADGYDI